MFLLLRDLLEVKCSVRVIPRVAKRIFNQFHVKKSVKISIARDVSGNAAADPAINVNS